VANKSGWKDLERQVAKDLGGQRRLRTMESFGKEATDVYFSAKLRRQFPKLKFVSVECKKRKTISINKEFAVAKLKYGSGGRDVILVYKRPATKAGRKSWKTARKQFGKKGLGNMKLKDFVAPLVTVEMPFFKQLWNAWLREPVRRFPR